MNASKRFRLWLPGAALFLACSLCRANDSFNSEFSHFAGGAITASAATAVADHYGVQQRAWVGFWTSTGISLVLEGVQVIANGSSQIKGAALDFGSNLIGAAIGAWVTDRYLLQPVIAKDSQGHYTVGVAFGMAF
ncbi:MAG: hypothetical protein ABIR94_06750 [Rubrivivax sp.]